LVSPKKTVVLIDSDSNLLDIIRKGFEAKGLIVKTFSEGKAALEQLINCDETELPSLIICERKLLDIDGLEILKSMHARYRVAIPFYFLTNFASEKDISEGLKYGALEYVTKPFSLSLLIQKSMKDIFNH
jgi:DNA-binding response OmpR family regulator